MPAIPVWLLRLLPYAAVVLALGVFIWWIDDNAADRTRTEIRAATAASEIKMRSDLRQTEARLAGTIMGIDGRLSDQLAGIEAKRVETSRIIEREIIREPRLVDPAAGLTPGLLDAVNRARSGGACSTRPDGSITCPLPETGTDP